MIDPVSLQAAQAETTYIEDSQVAEITIRTDSPLRVDSFDVTPESGRFAILQDGRTVGGGVIVK